MLRSRGLTFSGQYRERNQIRLNFMHVSAELLPEEHGRHATANYPLSRGFRFP